MKEAVLVKQQVKARAARNHVPVAVYGEALKGARCPLVRRIPKRGFTNIFKKNIVIVNVEDLNRFDAGEEVTPETLKEKGLIKSLGNGVKILGRGEIENSLQLKLMLSVNPQWIRLRLPGKVEV